jgi:hypothetical protein
MADPETARAAPCSAAAAGPPNLAHAVERRNFPAITFPPGCHSRSEVQAALAPSDTWEPLGTVLQRLLAKWEQEHRRG